MPTPVATFDAGQTFIELDLDFLAQRLAERRITVEVDALAAAAAGAWEAHDRRVREGASHPWHELMTALLEGAGITSVKPLVDWLFGEQARKNLWRKRIEDMVALARELDGRGVKIAVLSNSEGHLAELLDSIGIAAMWPVIVDSGVFGIAKPDRRIFQHALDRLGVSDANAIHIGDSYAADVEGALGAGWRAIWFGPRAGVSTDARVRTARDARACRAILDEWLR